MSSKTEDFPTPVSPAMVYGTFGLVRRTLDDPLLKILYIASQYGQSYWIEDDVVTYLMVGVLLSSKAASRAPAEL
jgi:hypothetical protein